MIKINLNKDYKFKDTDMFIAKFKLKPYLLFFIKKINKRGFVINRCWNIEENFKEVLIKEREKMIKFSILRVDLKYYKLNEKEKSEYSHKLILKELYK